MFMRTRTSKNARTVATAALIAAASLIGCGSEADGDDKGSPAAPLDAALSPAASNDSGAATSSGDAGAGGSNAPAVAATDGGASGVRDAGGSVTSDAGGSANGDAGASAEAGAPAAGGPCTRELLAAAVESYYKALSAHDPKLVNTSPSIKLTEDGKTIMLGEGLMKTAGMVKFKRSALDTEQCETVSESVVENSGSDYIVGVRLKVSAGLVSEVESILVGPSGWFPRPQLVIDSKSDDWEKPLLPEAERTPRDKIKRDIVDAYFIGVFGGTIKVADYPFASECKRAENGFSPGACNFGIPTTMPMTPLHYVIDVEAGIGVGFVLFGGRASGMDDFHMFRVKSGKVYGVRAVVGPSVMGRGWPSDPPAAMP
jgi:hypothetical protein